MANMLTEVSQAFNTLSRNYPQLKNILDRCYNEIRNFEKENADELQAQKKERVKYVLESSIDMRALNTAFDELLTEAANNENDLIDLLKRLTEAQAQEKKIFILCRKTGTFIERSKRATRCDDV